jgi:hypothetical protein
MHIHELEELEYRNGPKFWSADPTDCCGGMHQLGVCLKAEAEMAEMEAQMEWEALTDEERAAIDAREEARRAEAKRLELVEEPF